LRPNYADAVRNRFDQVLQHQLRSAQLVQSVCSDFHEPLVELNRIADLRGREALKLPPPYIPSGIPQLCAALCQKRRRGLERCHAALDATSPEAHALIPARSESNRRSHATAYGPIVTSKVERKKSGAPPKKPKVENEATDTEAHEEVDGEEPEDRPE